ncbi:MAG: Ppx/GppA family phosphatase [Alphaproteobacteria bacterium]|nr:Ppx/GppA family phosphatase [Alphaproteobacteria bacterium]
MIAALDLGTNNCRLLVAHPRPDGFKVIDGFSRIVRLGEGVAGSGNLSNAAMDRTLEALKMCAERIVRRDVTHGRYIATEACRQADNGEEFLERIEKEIGIRLETIPSREEAELTLTGCLPLLNPNIPYALTFDVGGGSAEVLWVKLRAEGPPEMLGWISLPCGVVTMTERYGNPDISSENYTKMIYDIRQLLKSFDDEFGISSAMKRGEVQMLGTAGTVTTIAGVQMGLNRYNRSAVDGSWLDFDAVHSVSSNLVNASFDERASYACVGRNRAELVVAGCGVLEAICKTWPAGRLRVADRGVREGILLGLSRLVLGQPEAANCASGRHARVPVSRTEIANGQGNASPAP